MPTHRRCTGAHTSTSGAHIAGTFSLYREYFKLEDRHMRFKEERAKGWVKNDSIFIDTYHPAYRSMKKADYINTIINMVSRWHGDLNA